MFSFKSIIKFILGPSICSIDGGFGEAALMGALVGGGASLLTGKNPLTGALMGGLTGGAMSGISGALAGTTDSLVKNQILSNAMENQGLPALVEPGTEAAANLDTFARSPYGIDLAQGTAGIADSGIVSAYNPNATSMMENIGQAGGYTPNPNYVGTTMPASQAYAAAPTATEAANAAVAQAPTAAADAAVKEAVKSKGILGGIKDWYATAPWYEKAGAGIAGSVALNKLFEPPKLVDPNVGKTKYSGPGLHDLSPDFQPLVVPQPVPYYTAQYAEGGIAELAGDGDKTNFMQGDMYPMSQQERSFYATPTQMPTSAQQAMASYEPNTNPLTGEATAHMAEGGVASLGSYAAGGSPRLLKGPGDGMSDNIPAVIGQKQPARLADGEFVVPADVVSHLGNGSTDAGAKQLYAMMDKVRAARTGNKKQGKQIKPEKYLPA